MESINVHDAKTHLSRYLEQVERGEELTIARAGRPVARLVPLSAGGGVRFGLLKERPVLPEDFDAPLPDDVLADFEGRA